jgi:hypothetical protein
VVPLPVVSITGLNSSYCVNAPAVVLTGLPGGGTFSGTGIANGQFNPSSAGIGTFTITYTYSDGNNCTNSTTQSITVNPLPTAPSVTPISPINICDGSSATLNAGPGYNSYEWKNTQGTIVGTGQSILVNSSSSYSVMVTNNFGCEILSAPTVVNVNPLPIINLGNDTTICLGGTISLNAGVPNATYLWSNGAVSQSITVSNQGVYSVTVTSANNCSATGSRTINTAQILVPVVTATGNTTICTGDSVRLTTTTFASYLWNDGLTTSQTYYAHTAGQVIVTVTDATGCTGSSVPVNINLLPLPAINISANGPTEFCTGSSVVLSGSPGFTNYQWSNNVQTESNTINQPGTYTVTAQGANGCFGTSAPVSVVVHFPPTPVITANGPTTFCKGGSVILTCEPNGQIYLWSSGNTTQAINVTVSGDYGVRVQDGFGCQDSTYILNPIHVEVISPMPLVTTSGNTFTSTPFQTYQWFRKGSGGNPDLAIPGANGISYTATQSGIYYVVVTDASGCTGKGFEIEHTYIGIENPEVFTRWNLFPNPADEMLTLEIGLAKPGDIAISIISMEGKIVRELDLGIQNKETIKSFPIGQLASGLYTILVRANGQVLRENFVKN